MLDINSAQLLLVRMGEELHNQIDGGFFDHFRNRLRFGTLPY